MSEFKVGDRVYYPLRGTRIFQLKYSDSQDYPVSIFYYPDDDNDFDTFTRGGLWYVNHTPPVIFHATEENHKLLGQLYGMEFETPPSPPTSKQIIQALLDKGELFVPCWVSTQNEYPTSEDTWVFICSVDDTQCPFDDTKSTYWTYATPFDIRTGKAITEIPYE